MPDEKTPLDVAREMVELYVKAEMAVLRSQSYTIGGQSLTKADLDKIRKGRLEWEAKVDQLSGLGRRVVTNIIPMDR